MINFPEKMNGHDFIEEVFQFQNKWIELVDNNPEAVYSDTDSAYLRTKLPFDKFENIERTVDYTQDIAKTANGYYAFFLNNQLHERMGLDPENNLMNFKSEVVATRGFFRSKKYYALLKLWDEGNFIDGGKIKKTGGQIVKADVTKITLDLLNDVYFHLVKNYEITDEISLFKKIFFELKNEYKIKLTEAIKKLDIDYFGIPKKWGIKEFKSIPTQVKGAMFYNLLFKDILRPGESFKVIQIKIKNFKKLLDLFNKKLKNKELSKYMINNEDINKKLNVISIPTITSEKEKQEMINKLNEYNIELDFDKIMDFNIDMKLIQFEDLFSDEIKIRTGYKKIK